MKVTNGNTAFIPVIIELETPLELDILYFHLYENDDDGKVAEVIDVEPHTVSDFIGEIVDKLEEKRKERK